MTAKCACRKIVKFRKNNKIPYGQDMQYYKGVPSGIEFEIFPFQSNRVKLIADGYGNLEGNYGNGAVYINTKDLTNYRKAVSKKGEL